MSNPKDPRVFLKNHKERGPERFSYTFQMIADCFGVKLSSLRADRERVIGFRLAESSGKLGVVVGFLAAGMKSEEATSEELEQRYGKGAGAKWSRRYPRFRLAHCSVPECKELVVGDGSCRRHGGSGSVGLDAKTGMFGFWIDGKWKPYHQVITGNESAFHINGNIWNNRLKNIGTREEGL